MANAMCIPSYDLSAVFQLKLQARSVGHSTAGSKRAMLVVTQRSRPGMPQDSLKGTWGKTNCNPA